MVLANSILGISVLQPFRHIPGTKISLCFDTRMEDIPTYMGAMRRRSGTVLLSMGQQKTALGSFYILFLEGYKKYI